MKQSIITAFLSKTQDRFSEYQTPTDLKERLKIVQKIDGVTGVEIVYPYETGEAQETKALMAEMELEFAAVNANIKKETKWVPGALSRPDADLRKGAVQMIKDAKDYAITVGAPLVTCCPLSDGYDNLFQVDYQKGWKNMIEAVAEAADYKPEMPLFIEYKINETRVNCFLDSCAKTIVFLKEVQNAATGITIDFGHSLLAKENPAEVLALCEQSNVDYYLHTNDNDWQFDWDLIGGSRNFLHTVEFFFYAKEFGYDKYFTADASPPYFRYDRIFYRTRRNEQGHMEYGRKFRSCQIQKVDARRKVYGFDEVGSKGNLPTINKRGAPVLLVHCFNLFSAPPPR